MHTEYNTLDGNSLFQRFKISIYLFIILIFMSVHTLGNADICPGATESSTIAQVKQIACATENLQEAVSKDDLLKKVSDVNFFSSNSDPRDVVRSVEERHILNPALGMTIKWFHHGRIHNKKKIFCRRHCLPV